MENKIPVMNILHDSTVDGEGLRSVVFVAGCPHQCKMCHNPQSWNANNGTLLSIDEIFTELMSNPLTDVTLSGGEPFLYAKQLIPLVKRLKNEGKNIWAYSGWTYEELQENADRKELLRYLDVLVDGRFIVEQRDISLLFRGSSNQRILFLQNGEILSKGV